MLKDRTADALQGRADMLRTAAQEAEDTCVKQQMLATAQEFERLRTLITPVLSPEASHAAR